MREVRDFVRLVHVRNDEILHYRRVFIAALFNELPLAPQDIIRGMKANRVSFSEKSLEYRSLCQLKRYVYGVKITFSITHILDRILEVCIFQPVFVNETLERRKKNQLQISRRMVSEVK